MIDSTAIDDDIERTQRLPLLTAEVQLEEVLQREQAAQHEILELTRRNRQQADELKRLEDSYHEALLARVQLPTGSLAGHLSTEETLFEVCGALRHTLSRVLAECQRRGLALDCGAAATGALERAGDGLERILSAPGFSADNAVARGVTAPGADLARRLPEVLVAAFA